MKTRKKLNKMNQFVEYFARIPFLWDIFETIFGADKPKQDLYRSKICKPCKIMDFGCASGNTTKAFLDFDYLGVDIDAQAINGAKSKWKKYHNVKFRQLNILNVPQKYDKFQAILFAGTGHHIQNDLLINIFNSLSNYLDRNGYLYYFDTIKPSSRSKFLTKWLCSIDRGKYMKTFSESKKILFSLKKYRIVELKKEQVEGTLLPQPAYIYAKLKLK